MEPWNQEPDVQAESSETTRPVSRRGKQMGESVHLRLQPDEIAALDRLRTGQRWTRPETIRLILRAAIAPTLPDKAA